MSRRDYAKDLAENLLKPWMKQRLKSASITMVIESQFQKYWKKER